MVSGLQSLRDHSNYIIQEVHTVNAKTRYFKTKKKFKYYQFQVGKLKINICYTQQQQQKQKTIHTSPKMTVSSSFFLN